MKKSFIILLLLLAYSCSDSPDSSNLSKNVEGKDLTKEFCINLVRNNWDCNMGAVYFRQNVGTVLPSQNYTEYGCYQGHMGEIINFINGSFDEGIDVEKSYYKNYILYLYVQYSNPYPSIYHTLTVNF